MSYIGNTPTQQSFTPAVDYFNGNGSTTAFTLSRPVASVAQVQAVIENVPQKPGDAFTVSGNTITFTSAPPSGTSNIYVYYTSPITQVIAPGQGTVGTTALADSAVTTEKIAAGAVIPSDLSAGAPTWSVSGGVSLPRIDSSSEGGQLNFNRASDNTPTWSIDSFGSTATPTLRFLDGANVRASFDGSGNFAFNSGYGSSATVYGCRAWVNFNGTGTIAIRASGNVTSITDNGVGDYTINFTNAMPDANYSIVGSTTISASNTATGSLMVMSGNPAGVPSIEAPSSSAVRIRTAQQGVNNAVDMQYVCASIFR